MKRLSPKTILNYRNLLQLPFSEAFNINFQSRPFKLLAKAQFIKKPPVQKIFPEWDINKVLTSLTITSSERSTKKNYFLKTIFLVALASGNRASELAATSRDGLVYTNNKVILPVLESFKYKNQNIERNPPPIEFPILKNHPLCPGNAVKEYVELTKDDPHNGHLFVSPITGKPLPAGRISYWITRAIMISHPDLKPRGHDVRKVAHSISFSRGTPLNQVIDRGFWSDSNVFYNKYNVPIPKCIEKCVAGRSVIVR